MFSWLVIVPFSLCSLVCANLFIIASAWVNHYDFFGFWLFLSSFSLLLLSLTFSSCTWTEPRLSLSLSLSFSLSVNHSSTFSWLSFISWLDIPQCTWFLSITFLNNTYRSILKPRFYYCHYCVTFLEVLILSLDSSLESTNFSFTLCIGESISLN